MSTPQSFSRFTELPLELQMQVWRYAADSQSNLQHHGSFLTDTVMLAHGMPSEYVMQLLTSINLLPSYLPQHAPEEAMAIAEKRHTLFITCSSSRQTMLEAWKREIAAIEVTAAPSAYFAGCLGSTIAQNKKAKQDMIAHMDILLGSITRTPRDAPRNDK